MGLVFPYSFDYSSFCSYCLLKSWTLIFLWVWVTRLLQSLIYSCDVNCIIVKKLEWKIKKLNPWSSFLHFIWKLIVEPKKGYLIILSWKLPFFWNLNTLTRLEQHYQARAQLWRLKQKHFKGSSCGQKSPPQCWVVSALSARALTFARRESLDKIAGQRIAKYTTKKTSESSSIRQTVYYGVSHVFHGS